MFYASGRVVNTMSTAYTGEGKTDAKDAYVIAETVRQRRDLPIVDPVEDSARDLALLTGHRADLVADRVRMINRLRDVLTSVFPPLETAFDYSSCKGALVLVTEYSNPQRLRRLGTARLAQWLRTRHVRDAAKVADRAVSAAHAQTVQLPGQDVATAIIADLAGHLLTLQERVRALDTQIAAVFRTRDHAAAIESMPGFGPILGAQLLVAAGDLTAFPSAGHLAAAAGLVPVPNDSGRRSGNLHRPRRYAPTPTPRLLPVSPDRDDAGRTQPGLLPQEAGQRTDPHPGADRPRPSPYRRPLGPAPRPPHLHRHPTRDRPGRLTTSLRFPVPGRRPGGDLRRPVTDQRHPPQLAPAGGLLGQFRQPQDPAGPQVTTQTPAQRAPAGLEQR